MTEKSKSSRRLFFVERLELIESGELHPDTLDLHFNTDLRRLGSVSLRQESRILDRLGIALDATEAFFADMSPLEYFFEDAESGTSTIGIYPAHPNQ